MTSPWRALHAYGEPVEALLTEIVGPFFAAHAGALDHGFWERHYVGGPHVRIRLCAAPRPLAALVVKLRAQLEDWIGAHPVPPARPYSAERAATLLRMERVDPATEDLEQRTRVVLERPYPEAGKTFKSAGARQLVEDFRRSRGPLAMELLGRAEPIDEAAFRLYLAVALHIGAGRYPPGSVSFKSHWEHFAAGSRSEVILERVRASYERRRQRLRTILDEVRCAWDERRGGDHLLARWWRLLDASHAQVTAILESGQQLVDHPTTPEQVAALRARMLNVNRPSAFVDALWRDGQFAAVVQYDVLSQRPRALVNLLYDLIAAIGLSPADKMALCHHAFHAVEEAYDCNLNDYVSRNIEAVLERQRHRLTESGESRAESALARGRTS